MTRFGGIGAVALAIGLDQLSKYWVETALPFQVPVPILPVLDLYRTYNTGIAFSMLSGLSDWVLALLTVAIVLFVLWLWSHTPAERRFAAAGYALIIGGALGNLVDRLIYGHVVDFILFHVGMWSFAVFNLADTFISVGAGLIILDEMIDFGKRKKTEVERRD